MAAVLAATWTVAASAAPDAARGRAVAEQHSCLTCHGADGISAMAEIPSLAGMPEQVVVLQMILMRENLRVIEAMKPFMQGLTEPQLEDLGAFFASLPPGPPEDRGARDAAKMTAGAELSDRARCGICHLPDYRGREQMPRIAGQREDYLLHALTQYRDSKRIGTDTQMNGVLHGMSDADLAALSHYMAQQ